MLRGGLGRTQGKVGAVFIGSDQQVISGEEVGGAVMRKRLIASSIAIGLCMLLQSASLSAQQNAVVSAQQDAAKTLKIQDGTIVRVIFTQELSSEKNHPQDPVPCEIAEDLKVGDVIVIAKGTPVVGQVSQAERKGGWGKSGTLAYSIDYVKAVDGRNIRLRGGSAQGGKQFSAGGAMMGLSGAFKKGKAITVAKGSTMNVYVDGDHEIILRVQAQ